MEINAICTVERGRVIDPAKAQDNADALNILSEMKAVQTMAQVIEELNGAIGGLVFTDETSRIFIDLARSTTETDPFEKRLRILNDMVAELTRRNKLTVLKEDVDNLQLAIGKIQTARQEYQALRGQLSQATQNLEFVLSRDSNRLRGLSLTYLPSLRDLVLQLNGRLPSGSKLDQTAITLEAINAKIGTICGDISKPAELRANRLAPTKKLAPVAESPAGERYRLVLGGGYATGEAGGIVGLGGASWQIFRSATFRGQVDYRGALALAPNIGESRSGADTLTGTAEWRTEGMNAHIQIGGERTRTTTLDADAARLVPNTFGFSQNGRFNFQLSKKFGLTIEDALFIGRRNDEPQTVIFGAAGISLRISEPLNVFAGGIFGGDRQLGGTGVGGYGGGAWLSERLDAAARFDFDSCRGAQLRAVAFFGGDLAGGPSFTLINRDNYQQIRAGAQGRIRFGRIYIQSEVAGGKISDEAGAISPVSAMIMVGYGALQPATLPLNPLSIDSPRGAF
ncbi:hypothetical protein A3K48_05135 [candidate division WOR-1 bacterium RIFOXYA12_FULL_52_29]|uniref:Uncharacterized protein n=1 Tax=candidate division WOR-1 bacterium RIFOXYC12_FULL_54_18 TaxID=1802584 RepID=A0A1F4T6Z9_UNCSA|nr:MAG: hypothetical protein A3K44_05135 [candidate division WOR-1 bacterium RIFOXYA2_FULL_51_19]OGC17930.1 MAG: hypothetical protein A3K48_05135 [candidate division WOR-1 bacterium RIFOXYA12_FULL_52_29]OGC26786.1 MAG: hypothetical protein A3K32_05130 [candidate division WOR-1 bacterium RIFOXYB2_FULL_45_9]OGC28347.1 MAG: hypothetical protein A3K49_05135 [candidate division WOR-1 bacterium RIFOXYC12_FULL_54_18]OGC31197.1 MAG: hypothetical protein A2346_07485 [candidate division WOR-1 bacterium R